MNLKYKEPDCIDCMKIWNLVPVKYEGKVGMHMEHFVLLNFLTHSKMFNWCLVLVKLREYQNLQAFLFNCKNSTTGGYIQSTLSILLKIEHIEIKKKVIQLFVFSVTRKWSLKIVLWESYEAGLKIFSSFFSSKHYLNSLDGNLIL